MKILITFFISGFIFGQNHTILLNNTWRLNFVQEGTNPPTYVPSNVDYILTFQNNNPFEYTLNICNWHKLIYNYTTENQFDRITSFSSLIICGTNNLPPNIMFFDNFVSSFYILNNPSIVPFTLTQNSNLYTFDIYSGNKRLNFENVVLNLENNKLEDFEIFPNPTSDKININTEKEIKSIKIFHLNGQKVFESFTIVNEIDLKDISNGIYLLKIYDKNDYLFMKKIVKK
ncbi:MAG: T9SS type A sorting domain-containing protein [Flavobacterium sp.]